MIVALMAAYHSSLALFYPSIEDRGAFGDQFGAINSLVAGATFFALVLSILFQSRDLRAQTEALRLQQEALQQQIAEFQKQKEEMRRSAQAQENSVAVLQRAAAAQERSNQIVKEQLKFEATKQRLAFAIVKFQQAGSEKQSRADTHARVLELIGELEKMARNLPAGTSHQ